MATGRDLGNKAKPKALTAKRLLPFARREHGLLRAKEPRRGRVAVPEQRASRNRPEEA